MSETASLLAEHGLIYGEPFTLAAPVTCACGELMPGGEDALFAHAVHRAHVAAILDAHYAERERALVKRVRVVDSTVTSLRDKHHRAGRRAVAKDMSSIGKALRAALVAPITLIPIVCGVCGEDTPNPSTEVHECKADIRTKSALTRPATEGEG